MTGSISNTLQTGSFRGVPFECALQASDETGRRLAIHRYPQRDEAYAEDLGRRQEPFEIEAIVTGSNWLDDAKKLYEACSRQGPGELVHPWLGLMRVVCLSAKRVFNARERGAAKFTLQFFEAADNVYPAAVQDTGVAVREAADAAIEPARIEYSQAVSTKGQSIVRERLRDRVADMRQSATRAFADSRNSISLDGAFDGDTLDIGRDVLGASDDALGFAEGTLRSARTGGRGGMSSLSSLLLGDYADLVDRPAQLANRTASIARLLGYSKTDPAAGARSLRSWNEPYSGQRASWTTPPRTVGQAQSVSGATATRSQAARNERALAELVDRAALAAEARRVPEYEFASREEALAYRDDLNARLMAAARRAADLGDDGSAAALTALRNAVARDLNARAGDLSRVASIRPASTQPSLRLAWQLYGDDPDTVLDRASEIAARNGVRHPGFVPGGRDIEVLLDE
jgi:prophage DNA circulation protein